MTPDTAIHSATLATTTLINAGSTENIVGLICLTVLCVIGMIVVAYVTTRD